MTQIHPKQLSSGGASNGQILVYNSGTALWTPTNTSNITFGPHSSRPTATNGSIYYPTDGLLPFISDGSTWYPMIGFGGLTGTQPPTASNFTKLGTSTYALNDVGGSLEVTSSSTETTDEAWQHSTVLGSTFDVSMCYTANWNSGGGGSESMPALIFRETSSGKFYRWGTYWSSNVLYGQCQYFTTLGTASTLKSTTTMTGRIDAGQPIWIKVIKDSSNIKFYYSANGRTWIQAYSETKDLHCVPNRCGIFSNKSNAFTFDILSFKIA